MEKLVCTICTPTYNRAYTLDRLYNSLVEQTNKNFEWIVIDDGSTDDTKDKISGFIEEGKINIHYELRENGGKHRAVNRGIELANASYFFILDSDDYLTEDAVETIKDNISAVDSKMDFCGFAFNRGYDRTTIIGTTFDGEYVDASNIERPRYNINGDKCEIFKTNILKENKFPEIEGENFMPEIVLWTRLASKGYKLRWFNKIIYICNYLEDGLTKNNDKLIEKNPKANALRIKEQISLANISLKERLGYYSKHYLVRKNSASMSEIAEELDTPKLVIYFSVLLRKIMRR